MRRPLTRRQMYLCISALKTTMDAFDRQHSRKLAFFNELCFYDHVRKLPLAASAPLGDAPATVDGLLDVIEPYLPLTLTEENFDLFLLAAQEGGGRWDSLPDYFTQKARIDFVAILKKAVGPEQWEWLFNVCDAIRELKNDLAELYE